MTPARLDRWLGIAGNYWFQGCILNENNEWATIGEPYPTESGAECCVEYWAKKNGIPLVWKETK